MQVEVELHRGVQDLLSALSIKYVSRVDCNCMFLLALIGLQGVFSCGGRTVPPRSVTLASVTLLSVESLEIDPCHHFYPCRNLRS